jgi:hypothetical protein
VDAKKLLMIGIAVGVLFNVLDFVVQANLLRGYYTQAPFRQDSTIGWMILGDFVAAFVFAWVYLAVVGSFGPGPANGARMGFYAGVFMSFPSAIFIHLMFQGIPYFLSWIWTFYGVFYYFCAGAIAGALNKG